MHSKILAERVFELKETEKEVDFICREMEQLYNDGVEIVELKAKKEMAYSLLEEGMSVEQIARLVKVNIKDVQNWIDERVSLVK